MNDLQTLSLEVGGDGIAILAVSRPEKLNALNAQVLADLDAAITRLESDPAVKGVILTGAGPKAFVAGADIAELSRLSEEEGERLSRRGQDVFLRIEQSRLPWVAAVNGFALGGGAELAMACHLRVGAPNAVFGLPEVKLGLIPGYGGTQRLPKLIGRSRAMDLILTGRFMKADEALDAGLINRRSEAENMMDVAKELLSQVLDKGPLAVRHAIQAVLSADLPEGYAREAALFGALCDTDDMREGTSAFLEKRPPEFKGE